MDDEWDDYNGYQDNDDYADYDGDSVHDMWVDYTKDVYEDDSYNDSYDDFEDVDEEWYDMGDVEDIPGYQTQNSSTTPHTNSGMSMAEFLLLSSALDLARKPIPKELRSENDIRAYEVKLRDGLGKARQTLEKAEVKRSCVIGKKKIGKFDRRITEKRNEIKLIEQRLRETKKLLQEKTPATPTPPQPEKTDSRSLVTGIALIALALLILCFLLLLRD